MARNTAIRTVIWLPRNTLRTPNTLFVYHDRREVNGRSRRFHVHGLLQLSRTNRGTHDWTSLASRHLKEPAMAQLTTATRKKIPTSEFALPGRRYPIEDEAHARNALSRVSQDGTPAEKATVRRKVHRLVPGFKLES